MNRIALLGSVAITALTAAIPALAADWYVAPTGSGSACTLAAPCRQISTPLPNAGDTVHVAAGTYNGGFTTTRSGTTSQRIKYVSDTTLGAKIVGSNNGAAVGWWQKGNYVDVVGFDMSGTGSAAESWRVGFYGDGSHMTFKENHAHDIASSAAGYANANRDGFGGAGMECDNHAGAVNCDIIRNRVWNIGLAGESSELVHGIYQITEGNVESNVVHDVVGWGIHLFHDAHDINIVNNTIYKAGFGGVVLGVGSGPVSSRAGDYIYVANNIVSTSVRGIAEGTSHPGTHNTHANNLLYNNTTYAYSLVHSTHTGTLLTDPKFKDPGNDDFTLLTGSPAIDSGLTLTIGGSPDLAGVTRPQGAAWDRGALEFAPAPPPPELPDLIVTTFNYDEATGHFSVTLKNQGLGPTPTGVSVGVAIFVDGVGRTWANIAGSASLAPGASITVNTAQGGGAYMMATGSHNVEARSDDQHRFAESDETNNSLFQTIVVGGPPALPDLIVESFTYDYATGNFTAVLKNQGAGSTPTGVSVGMAFFIDGVGETWANIPGSVSLGAGESATVTTANGGGPHVLSRGCYVVEARSDDQHRFDETDETNNSLTQTIPVQ